MSRIMFRFWLDDTKTEENQLIEEVDKLKGERNFTSTLRDGIKLITSLRAGSLNILFSLFPFVRAEWIQADASAPPQM